MIKKITYPILAILMIFIVKLDCNAQSVSDLEQKINRLQNEIQTSQNLLSQTAKNKETTVHEVELLQAQIKNRDDLIAAYNKQLDALNKSTKAYNNDIKRLQNDLQKSRQEYADLLVLSYRNRSNINNLLFIFSSEDFNQAIRRMRYIQQFKDLLKHKMEDIDKTKDDIRKRIEKNDADKKRIEELKADQKKERDKLNEDKKALDKKIKDLKKKEKDIKNEIARKKKETDDLQAKIKKIIADEMARRKADATIDTRLSESFEANKGKLPWPVKNGVIIGKYGNNQHPTQSKVVVHNNGIDISTEHGAEALCVFNGDVMAVLDPQNSSSMLYFAVMVRHGLYITLYSNLDRVYVKAGDKVKTGQKLGVIHTDANDNVTILHFEVWKNKKNADPENTNPEPWLK